jgi:hypothetical protein
MYRAKNVLSAKFSASAGGAFRACARAVNIAPSVETSSAPRAVSTEIVLQTILLR